MNERRRDIAWRLLVALVQDILNPLLLISLALFMSVGCLLTFLIPVNIDVWVELLRFSWLAPLCALCWRRGTRASTSHSFTCAAPERVCAGRDGFNRLAL